MSFRTVAIKTQAKLEFRQNYMIVRSKNETIKVYISEISVLIIENTAVCITAVLLQELIKKKITVIFCDNERNPCSNLIPFYGSHDNSEKIRTQITWKDKIKNEVWTEIVKEKVRKQGQLISLLKIEDEGYYIDKVNEITINDEKNIEAQTAKKYFHHLFGNNFVRDSETSINSALNYGYMILLSLFNREVTKRGYLTQLGINHESIRNSFNLSCDLMEPFRPIVDGTVICLDLDSSFTSANKHDVLDMFNKILIINNKAYCLADAIDIYCSSIFKAINQKDINLIEFYDYGEK